MQRLLICGTRYKNDLRMEEGRSQELREQIEELDGRLENAARTSKMDMATIEELRGVIGNKNHSSISSMEFFIFLIVRGCLEAKGCGTDT